MKARLTMGLAIAGAVFWAAACGHSCSGCGPRTDITLQGPWILYQDTAFQTDRGKVSVLIAIAPMNGLDTSAPPQGNPNEKILHMPPMVSNGDSYPVRKPGVYCLTFGDVCAPRGPHRMEPDHYPGAQLLDVQPAPGRDWFTAGSGQVVFILPMPDTFSAHGSWGAHFAQTFDEMGAAYVAQQGSETHAIGITLHYAKGPEYFDLRKCQDGTRTAETCDQPFSPKASASGRSNANLINHGFLQIEMKAPLGAGACDSHVRFVYPKMLDILDPNRVQERNKNILVIEPANSTADGTPQYEHNLDPNPKGCFHTMDCQNPKGASDLSCMPMPPQPDPLTEENLQKIRQALKYLCDPQKKLGLVPNCAQLSFLAADIDPDIPRTSELTMFVSLLGQAGTYADKGLNLGLAKHTKKTAAPQAHPPEQASSTDPETLAFLKALRDAAEDMVKYEQPKTGSDCLAFTVMAN
jgi:hypothetical protein